VTRLAAFGIALEVPAGWEARAFRHEAGEPTIHLASFALPPADGEFGTRATAGMGDDAVFVALTEYRVTAADLRHGIFAGRRPRTFRPEMLSERTLLRPVAGQRGLQRFFSTSGRGFCLYVVAGRDGARRLAEVDRVLASLGVDPLR
jgi:hypothetical protein